MKIGLFVWVDLVEQILQQIEKTLRVYLHRGEKAIEAFQKGELDEAIEHLTWRKAAYHNLLVLDDQAVRSQPGYFSGDVFSSLWHLIRESSQTLESLVSVHCESLGQQLSKLQNQRTKINKFKSIHDRTQRFQREV
ncbi:hypothetical protein [Pseudobacteriovorax antillogorgiicola]|uniref:Uncharacterized protein n=1 Tax=Pseudobacteriovorax antillogorgiicola TaxID=1513793 RepID=A0A1Y6B6U8_9BACT|nr:hypothetical protein [Pseudobacteriovorax antillogorgiicola]TCS58706.1 hypothetical protein EDD56_102219 [Pseudobacteriovorax antillogorgiicola]SME95592.1 hypothetical protein SAMN06296036_102224 [Pseudobacteriovorax antillogorgiicola]